MKLKNLISLAMGLFIGIGLTFPAARGAELLFTAIPSTQSFCVDGECVEFDAHAINGNNYIKLREVGAAVGFNVSYDPVSNAVLIVTAEPYSEDRPVVEKK